MIELEGRQYLLKHSTKTRRFIIHILKFMVPKWYTPPERLSSSYRQRLFYGHRWLHNSWLHDYYMASFGRFECATTVFHPSIAAQCANIVSPSSAMPHSHVDTISAPSRPGRSVSPPFNLWWKLDPASRICWKPWPSFPSVAMHVFFYLVRDGVPLLSCIHVGVCLSSLPSTAQLVASILLSDTSA